jgi:hypothetical protein
MTDQENVVVDEARFGRMLGNLRRAGMYRHCSCAGCGDCGQAARKLLQSIVARGQFAGVYRPQQLGQRFHVYQYPLRDKQVNVLTDTAGVPTVVDVNVDNVDSDSEPQEELGLGSLLAKKLPSSAPQKVRTFLGTFTPTATPLFQFVSGIAKVPKTKGLYVLQWPNGQYLGKADNLYDRLLKHQQSMRRFGLNPTHYKMYVATTAGDPRSVEKNILETLAKQIGGVGNFRRQLGMTNIKTELEWESDV